MEQMGGNDKMNKWIRFFQIEFLVLNIVSVLSICEFIIYTTKKMIGNYDSRPFLEMVQVLPIRLSFMRLFAILLLATLVVTMVLREKVFVKHTKFIFITLVIEFVVSVAILLLFNFNYSGILLLVFANVIAHLKAGKSRFILMAVAIMTYLLADYDLLSINYSLFSIQSYIHYYSAQTQQYLLGSYNILFSLSIISFIVYCVQVIREQRGRFDEVSHLYEELQDANAQLKEYASMAEKMAQTRERNRLAREIHDTLGHTLTGISAGLDACMATIDIAPDQTKKQLEMLGGVTRKGIKEVRQSVNELRPDALTRLSLKHAIESMVREMNAMADAQIDFSCNMDEFCFDADEETAIYRVIQEGMTNALRHGSAKRIDITMRRQEDDIHILIVDNGIGCENIKQGFGTKHIMERIGMLGGTVLFDGSNGFTIDAKIPIRWGDKHD